MLNGRMETWGPQLFLDGAAVAYTQTGPNRTKVHQSAHLMLVHLDVEPQWARALNSDRRISGVAPVGAIDIVGAGNEAFASWSSEKRSLRVDVDPARMERLAGVEFDKSAFEIQAPRFGLIDKQAHMLASLLQMEIMRGDDTSMEIFDALVTIFSIHALRNYSSFGMKLLPSVNGGLAPVTWRRVQEFIFENLGKPLAVEQMASVAGLSPSHFLRSFKKTTGQSPHQFVITARLNHAQDLIRNSNLDFSVIAESAGFASHSHMTAMMKRVWGSTPSRIRNDR
nr:AraC family transcriptional regulator [Mesorhizobium loti]